MEANAWWLLAIPLFFGLGWLASRLDSAQLLTETRALPTSYFNGLNFLLADQPEKAIVAFEEVARLDPETAELYFALGQLFRRRGEAERAIRIHKNLLKRADLPAAQREQALFELAQDFVAAGIFDHAEEAFAQLVGTRYAAQAQRELARLYEKEANWSAAIQCAHNYLASSPSPDTLAIHKTQQDLAHYGCELAAMHLEANQPKDAQIALEAAADADARNPRLPFLRAQLAYVASEPQVGLAQLDLAVQAQPALTALALQTALQYATTPSETELNTLLAWAVACPTAFAVQALSPHLEAAQRSADSILLLNALARQIGAAHTTGGLAAVRSLWSASQVAPDGTSPAERDAWAAAAHTASAALIHRYDRPQCTACGFKASRHHWRCPGCGQWGTLPFAA
jgi:lipopolysaccharide assembly protein B